MKKETNHPYIIKSVSELHRLLSLPKPEHPLVSVIDLNDLHDSCRLTEGVYVYDFYSICIKKDFKGKLKYGQNYYDFQEGVMTFFSPGQVISTEIGEELPPSGIWLIVHADFVRNYPLGKKMKDYGFFSYAVNEALHLSDKEEKTIWAIMKSIEQEYRSTIDNFSQDVIISQIEVLLNYSNRFYNRQFITRKHASNTLLASLEDFLDNYFKNGLVQEKGIPSVQLISEHLHVSAHYLSDMLRSLTGQSTQHHIHNKLVETAKEILSTTGLSVSEIAYTLGFEYPQSFNKFFKKKTSISPLEFRNSFTLS